MKRRMLAAAVITTSLAPALTQANEVDDRIDRLEQEIQSLKEARSGSATGSAQSAADSGTTLSYGGYIKFDGQVSEYSDGSGASAGIGEDFLVPSTIPVGGSSGDMNTHFNAKETRLWLKSATQTSAGVINGHIEIDFEGGGDGNERVSNSYAPRIRHAYFTWDKWLFGQTWTTFFNVSALPDLLDFVGPVGTIFVRQAQVRYTSGAFQFALENPSSTFYSGTQNPYDDNQIPDLIARYNFGDAKTNLSASVMLRELAYNDGVTDDSDYGYAISLAGKIAIGESGDDLRVMINQGNALGRYMGLNAFRGGAITPAGGVDLIDEWGVVVAYRHLWDEQWRSSFSVSAAGADNPAEAGLTAAKEYQTLHANLVYKPVAALDLGGELIYGDKEIESGTSGNVTRLQFSAKYAF
ncbi:DcaP family trimeric outer membrane transporter [Ketobacter sp.]